MFYEWVSAGAQFGVEAFFAIFVFLMICGLVLGLLGLLATIAKALGDGEKKDGDKW